MLHPQGLSKSRALLAFAAAVAASLGAHAATPSLPDIALENPAPGVYVHYGRQEPMTAANGGDVANIGFIVGTRCVAVVDTGGTYAVGAALHAAVRRVTQLPICYVLNTHVHPDHVFGNAAFAGEQPQFIGHARLAASLGRRAANYLHALQRDLGEAADGTTIVPPTQTVQSTRRLDLGERVLLLRAWPTAHTDCDLTVYDEATKTLWLGDLLFVGHLPVVDGSLRGFLAVIDELSKLPAERAIPGHGRGSAWPRDLVAEQTYLRQLQDSVRAAIKSGRTLAQAVENVSVGSDAWLLQDEFHRRNVSAAYAELEWEQ